MDHTKNLKAAFDMLGIVSPKTEHFSRYCASTILDMEEVDPTTVRAIGNWAIDTFGEVYSSKLPLPAVRVLAGGIQGVFFFGIQEQPSKEMMNMESLQRNCFLG